MNPALFVAPAHHPVYHQGSTSVRRVRVFRQGVHYGVFPGERHADGRLRTVWNVVRPHNWHPKTSEEHLVQIDVEQGGCGTGR